MGSMVRRTLRRHILQPPHQDSMLQNAQVVVVDALQGVLHELVIPHVVLICHLSDGYAFVQMLMCSARDGSRDHTARPLCLFLLQETCLLCRSARPLHGCIDRCSCCTVGGVK